MNTPEKRPKSRTEERVHWWIRNYQSLDGALRFIEAELSKMKAVVDRKPYVIGNQYQGLNDRHIRRYIRSYEKHFAILLKYRNHKLNV
jgi:hypothetical protein